MFTKYNKELYSKIVCHVDKVLKHARSRKFLEDDEIVEILLVGGSTRMPYVEELLKSTFSNVWISKSINRDEAVACGAAVQAALLNGDKFDSTIHLVEDITPRSLCINIKDNIIGICIPAHSKIPSQGTILTFQSIPQMSQVPICSICEMSQNTQKVYFSTVNAINCKHCMLVNEKFIS